MQLQLDEVRRLTGPNLLWDKPGAIVDVFVDGIDKEKVALCWQNWTRKLLDQFGWPDEMTTYRLHADGVNMAMSAPMDALYTACELAELAWECCAAELEQSQQPDYASRLLELKTELTEEVNPPLLELLHMADVNQVTCLSDDDEVSLGMGPTVRIWPVGELPALDQIQWDQYRDIPTALITGTNGKSTSVRLASEIAKAAGIEAGVTSTDFIRVGDDIIDHGDYSGPGGARMLLRDKRTEMAFLEVARGGILRRGLPVQRVDAALITNVASDHLGQYGINTVAELAEVKFVVSKALDEQGILVLNADNALVVDQAEHQNKQICWFSSKEEHPLIQQQLGRQGPAVFVRESTIYYADKGQVETVAQLKDIPMTLDGKAEHNVQNALGVVGLCKALKLPDAAIVQGLHSFGSNASDNPGRGNFYQVNDCQVIVDFAHNEHSMRAIVSMAKTLPANRTLVMFSHAGDRSDNDIRDLTNAVADLDADVYIMAELEDYLRGRELGDIPKLCEQFLAERGVTEQQMVFAKTPFDGTQQALALAQPGDVVLLFVLSNRKQVHNFLSDDEGQVE